MPKPRAKLTAAEEAIIDKGGEPGNGASATVAPIRQAKTKAVEKPTVPQEDAGVQRPIMVRFNPSDFAAVAAAARRLADELSMRVSLNAWIVSACREKLEREKK